MYNGIEGWCRGVLSKRVQRCWEEDFEDITASGMEWEGRKEVGRARGCA